MRMTAIFYHGWGFDSSIWRGVVSLLDGWRTLFVDRGYFGEPLEPTPDGPCVVVAHSFGTMLALRDLPPGCIGIVAVNGFDRFVGGETLPGVHPRILKRMTSRFRNAPEAVLREFRARCSCDTSPAECNVRTLGDDLNQLATLDCRDRVAGTTLPILSLQGDADPILPKAMRDSTFGRALSIERRTVAGGGHVLPLTAPDACFDAIRKLSGVPA